MKLNIDAKYIEVHADWYEKNPAKTTSYEKASYDVKKGYAIVISPNAIKLIKKQKPVKQIVLERDKYKCQYCGGYGDTVDHIIPKSKYQMYTTEEMLICACYECNQLKGNRPVHEFIKDLIKNELMKVIKKL